MDCPDFLASYPSNYGFPVGKSRMDTGIHTVGVDSGNMRHHHAGASR
jgi:hypothetical protein